MTSRSSLALAAGGGASLLLICGFTVVLPLLGASFATAGCKESPIATPADTTVGDWSTTEKAHATTIVAVASQRVVPPRGWVIAVATAMQESSLRNLANTAVPRSLTFPHDASGSDHDSLGLFQQRVNPPDGQGDWGSVNELMTPATAAAKFYPALLKVEAWQQMRLTDAAQHTQRSATPQAYQKWKHAAQTLVATVASQGSWAIPGHLEQCVSTAGWTHPLPGHKVTSGFRTTERPTHDGVDLPAPRGTPIRAAASGVVIRVLCDAYSDSQCDADGSPQMPGCGWFSEIRSGEFIHRYCHQLTKPSLVPGQTVDVGQVIGVVGTSGHSSGPHLHLEIHKGLVARSQNAISPMDHFLFMGIDLNG